MTLDATRPIIEHDARELAPLAKAHSVAQEEAGAVAVGQAQLVPHRRVRDRLELRLRERAAVWVGCARGLVDALQWRREGVLDLGQLGKGEGGGLDDRVGVRLPAHQVARLVLREELLVLFVLLVRLLLVLLLVICRRGRGRPIGGGDGGGETRSHIGGWNGGHLGGLRLLLELEPLRRPRRRAVADAVRAPVFALGPHVVAEPAIALIARDLALVRHGLGGKFVDQAVEARVGHIAHCLRAGGRV